MEKRASVKIYSIIFITTCQTLIATDTNQGLLVRGLRSEKRNKF